MSRPAAWLRPDALALVIAAAAMAACVKGKSNDEAAGSAAAGSAKGSAAAGSAAAGSAQGSAAAGSAAGSAAAGSAVGSAAAGSAAAGATTGATAIRIDSEASAKTAIGKRVRIEGTGDNAKLGAIVVVGDLIVYCTDRKDGWADRNLPVVVEGVLQSSAAPMARTDPDGTHTAGTGAPIYQMACTVVP